jgi:hypothetical protein
LRWFGHGGCEQKCLIGVESWHTAVMTKPWRTFCRPGTKFIEVYVFRGTMLYEASSLSSYTEYEEDTGAVSLQYVLDHLITGTWFAKSVTSKLTLPSVLALVIYYSPLKDVCLNLFAE